MKLEVEMYVRTQNGLISKIQGINEYSIALKNTCCERLRDKYFTFPNEEKIYEISKTSHNIIDLIEVGDYVNGDLVLFAGATTWDNDGNVLDKQVHINHNGYDWWLREEYIKSIVTKEQFESNAYKIEKER